MSGGDLLFVALLLLAASCAVLLGAKLHRMLLRDGPYWVGTSPWQIDKRTARGDHVFFVGVTGFAFLISLGLTALFLFAAVGSYF